MAALSHNPFDFHETAREFGRSILSGRGARSQTVRAWMKKKQRDLDEHRAWLRSKDYEDDEPARKMQSTIDWWKEALDVVDGARRIKKQPNPLFGFGKKRKARPSARPGKRSSMTISQAVSAAYQAGARIGDTGAFDGWLEKEGLAGRGAQLRGRLETQFRKGVEDGEAPAVKGRKGRKKSYTGGRRIYQEDGIWRAAIDPESEFESEADAKRFVDAQKNPARVTITEIDDALFKSEIRHLLREPYKHMEYSEYLKKFKGPLYAIYVDGELFKAGLNKKEAQRYLFGGGRWWNPDSEKDAKRFVDAQRRNPRHGNPDGAALLLTPGPGLLEEEIMLAGSLFGGKKKKNQDDPGLEAYRETHPKLIAANLRLQHAHDAMSHSRWGETRRFAGRSAGLRLDRLAAAQEHWGKIFDRVTREYEGQKQNPHGTSRLPVHLSRVLSSNGGGRKLRLWKVEPIPGPQGWITLQGVYATRGQAEKKTLDVVRTALRDWDGRVELQFREVGRG